MNGIIELLKIFLDPYIIIPALLVGVIVFIISMHMEKKAHDNIKELNLDEAIKHAEEKGYGDDQCSADHRQFARWLKHYKELLKIVDR